MSGFAELVAATNFSFLRGASHAPEIVQQAAALGLKAIGIADRNTLAGVVRAHVAAKEAGHPACGRRAPGHHRRLRGGLPSDRSRRLWPAVPLADGRQPARAEGRMPSVVRGDPRGPGRADLHRHAAARSRSFLRRTPWRHWLPPAPGRVHLGASFHYRGDERRRLGELAELALRPARRSSRRTTYSITIPARRRLADVLACIREKCTIAEAGYRLEANAERHLKRRRRDGAAVRALSGSRRAHARDCRASQLFAGGAEL